ncbi:KH domain-containing protein [Candidatus Dojkabacteria bacterium]|nr:KH domain-containing protein [Candidatus Dojkabacteria bacterium]
MKELLEKIIKGIVNNPDQVKIKEVINEDDPSYITYEIDCASDDKALIIGKKGQNISAIRNVVSIKAIKENKRIRIDICDEITQDLIGDDI